MSATGWGEGLGLGGLMGSLLGLFIRGIRIFIFRGLF